MKTNDSIVSRLLSWVGVLVIMLIVLVVNVLFGLVGRTRIDFTEDKLYTLSEGTVNIVNSLDTPVDIRYYRTTDREVLPEHIEVYIKRVEDILREYQKRSSSKGKISVELLDPEPNSDDEVAALQAGIGKVSANAVESFFNGIEVQCLDKKVALPFLDPQQETLLEYEISRAVAEVAQPKKSKVAIMTDEQINGAPMNPMNPMAGGGQGWALPKLLERDYELETLPLSTTEISKDIDLLILLHPKAISEAAEYAIDQFVLRGGKLIACVDPKFYWGQNPNQNPMQMAQGGSTDSSTLTKLFTSWGVAFTDSQVVGDMTYRMVLSNQNREQIEEPRVLGLNAEAMNKDEPATASLQNVLMWESGAFSGTPAPGLTKTTLVKSSVNSEMVAPSTPYGGNDAQKIVQSFKAGGKELDLAILLNGKFKTAFPDGKPKAPEAAKEDGDDEEKTPEADKKEETAPLTESAEESAVALIGDVDIFFDRTYLQNFGGAMVMTNSNVVLLQNLMEQLAGNSNLIKIRSRAAAQRSFTKIREMDEENDARYREELQKLQSEIDMAQADLAKVEQEKGAQGAGPFTLSPERQEARKKIYQTLGKAKEAYRQVELKKRKDQEALKTKLKVLNILLVPMIVIFVGLALAAIRKVKTAAK